MKCRGPGQPGGVESGWRGQDHRRVASGGVIGGADPAAGPGRGLVPAAAGVTRGGHRHCPGPRRAGRAGHAPGEHLLRVAAALAVTGSRSAGSHRRRPVCTDWAWWAPARAEGWGRAASRRTGGPRDRRRPGAQGGAAGHVVSCRGVPVTSVARTVVDLARVVPFAEGVAVADSALRDRLTTGRTHRVLAGCARWPVNRRAREVTAFSDPRRSRCWSPSAGPCSTIPPPPTGAAGWLGDEGEIVGRRTSCGGGTGRSVSRGAMKYESGPGAGAAETRCPAARRRSSRWCTSPGRRSPGARPSRGLSPGGVQAEKNSHPGAMTASASASVARAFR